jgi:short-subunit dehydrogenase
MPRISFRTALVTGASSGLGAEYARQLAARGTDLILVARRFDRLEALGAALRAKHGVSIEVVKADLADAEDVGRVERLIAEGMIIDLLVNNAGFAGRTGFVKGGTADHIGMVRVHVDAAVRLIRAALPGMIERGRGAVINVASVAAFSPFSGAMYSGTKAFLVMFSENLQAEVRSKGIVIQALCPGLTHTEFHAVADMDLSAVPKSIWQTAEKVVCTSLRRLGRGVVCVTGFPNKVGAFLMRCPLTVGAFRAVGRSRPFRRTTKR